MKTKTTMSAIATALALMCPAARATILTFDIEGLADGRPIPGEYGDNVTRLTHGLFHYEQGNAFTPDIVVEYSTRLLFNDAVVSQFLQLGETGFGDLAFVAQIGSGCFCYSEIVLTATSPGAAVQLNGFDLAALGAVDAFGVNVSVIPSSGAPVHMNNTTVVGGSSHSNFDFTVAAPSIAIRFESIVSFPVAIDNIDFDQVAPQTAVPEAGSVSLLGLGLISLGLVGRRIRCN